MSYLAKSAHFHRDFSVRLSKWQYVEGLLDQRHFLKWSLDQLKSANFDQTNLMLSIASSFMDEYSRSRALMRYLIDTALSKVRKLHPARNMSEIVRQQYTDLIHLLQYAIISAPDTAVAPKFWSLCQDVINEVFDTPPPKSMPSEVCKSVEKVLKVLRDVIQHRNEMLLNPKSDRKLPEPFAFKALDDVDMDTDLRTLTKKCLAYIKERFPPRSGDASANPIHQLCWWTLDEQHPGEHRSYLVAFLLKNCADENGQKESIQNELVQFLHAYAAEKHIKDGDQKVIYHLFGELSRLGVFSYQQFLQRLVSRGDLEMMDEGDSAKTARYLDLLKQLPVYNAEAYQLNTRRVVLYGVCNNDEDVKDTQQYKLVKETLMSILPHMFKHGAVDTSLTSPWRDELKDYPASRLDESFLDTLRRMKRFWQVKVGEWLKMQVFKYVVQDTE
ncbi:RNA polymerase II mediator complex subunit [Quaeritorhiza haematococci]|nr:RNA polymerase II mediator complex subunit [Quaeritorhiza haematococci]